MNFFQITYIVLFAIITISNALFYIGAKNFHEKTKKLLAEAFKSNPNTTSNAADTRDPLAGINL